MTRRFRLALLKHRQAIRVYATNPPRMPGDAGPARLASTVQYQRLRHSMPNLRTARAGRLAPARARADLAAMSRPAIPIDQTIGGRQGTADHGVQRRYRFQKYRPENAPEIDRPARPEAP
jgi:hypothetical protein